MPVKYIPISHTSASLLKCFKDVTVIRVERSVPDFKTADGDTLIELVCQSEVCISHVSTAVLSKWLSDTTLDLEEIIIRPEWKTADGVSYSFAVITVVSRTGIFVSRSPPPSSLTLAMKSSYVNA